MQERGPFVPKIPEEFQEGDFYRYWPGKAIIESDNNLYSLPTMSHHPLQLDANFASAPTRTAAGGRNPLFSLAVGLTVCDVSGCATAIVGYEDLTAPVAARSIDNRLGAARSLAGGEGGEAITTSLNR